ncbi:hypothetical protein [Methanorbis furvi]|uniref:Uncharacterized protein n=1 Tax=Methanorbis furvi TaxID=3028299 RepID=A0AAE4MFR5_9EURY|nr:hypothetical protein [Methanocorpusculaceae archaeon Ag1]
MTEKMFTVTLEFNENALLELEYLYERMPKTTAISKMIGAAIKAANSQLENVQAVDWL